MDVSNILPCSPHCPRWMQGVSRSCPDAAWALLDATLPAGRIQFRKEPNFCIVPQHSFHALIFLPCASMPNGMTQKVLTEKEKRITPTHADSAQKEVSVCGWRTNTRNSDAHFPDPSQFIIYYYFSLVCYDRPQICLTQEPQNVAPINGDNPPNRYVCWSSEKEKRYHSFHSGTCLSSASGFRGRWKWSRATFLAAFLSRVFSCRPSLTHTPTVPHLQRLSSNTVIFLQASQNSALCVTACLFCRKSKDVNKRLEHPALGWARLPRVRVNYWLELVYSYWKSVRKNNADIL